MEITFMVVKTLAKDIMEEVWAVEKTWWAGMEPVQRKFVNCAHDEKTACLLMAQYIRELGVEDYD